MLPPRDWARRISAGRPSALKLLRQNIRWFSLPALLLMCVAVTMAWQENDRWDASLGRIVLHGGAAVLLAGPAPRSSPGERACSRR